MDLIWDGIREAFRLIFTGNAEVYEITLLSLTVSGAATGIALVIGLAVASFLAFRAPPGRTLALSVLNSGMALPPPPPRPPLPLPPFPPPPPPRPPPLPPRRRHGRLRRRRLGGRRHHHGRRQRQGLNPHPHLRHRPRGLPRQLRDR